MLVATGFSRKSGTSYPAAWIAYGACKPQRVPIASASSVSLRIISANSS
jgi:hypothetical protein